MSAAARLLSHARSLQLLFYRSHHSGMRRSLGGVAVLLLFDSARCAPVPESIWAAVSGCAALKDTKNSIGEKSLSAALDPHSSGRRGAGCDSQGPATVVVGL